MKTHVAVEQLRALLVSLSAALLILNVNLARVCVSSVLVREITVRNLQDALVDFSISISAV